MLLQINVYDLQCAYFIDKIADFTDEMILLFLSGVPVFWSKGFYGGANESLLRILNKITLMKKLLFILLTLLYTSSNLYAQLNYVYNKKLNEVFDSICNKYMIKGVSSAIIVPGEGTWERTFGESHKGAPITSDMYLGIGSNTKTYIAALMLKLQEQNKLSLDDTIGTWVQHPNIPGTITVRQLLNHTSGLYSFTFNPDMNKYILPDFTRIWPPDSVLNLVKPPVAAPGGAWDYCNTNFLVAGLIIRAVTGQAAHVVLRNEILTPQGLNETFFYPYEMPTGTIPHAWSDVLSPGSYMEDMDVVHSYSHNAMFSLAGTAGALMTTARDNALFWDKLMSGKILNTASMAEFETLVPISLGQGYGLGVFSFSNYNGRDVVSHGGTNFGFINDNIHDKTSGVSITVLTNQDSVSNGILLNILIRALHQVTIQYTDVQAPLLNKSTVQVYPNPARDVLNINVADGKKAEVKLYDIAGRVVFEQRLDNKVNMIDIRNISGGTYFIYITSGGAFLHRQTIQVVK